MKMRDILDPLLEWKPPETFFVFEFPTSKQLNEFVAFLTTIGHSIPDRDFMIINDVTIQVVEHKIGYQCMEAVKAAHGKILGPSKRAA